MLTFRVLTYKDKDTYTGVCLDLDIVEEDHASLEEARLSIQEAVEVYIETVLETVDDSNKIKKLLYRPAPRKYWEKAKRLTARRPKSKELPQLLPFMYSAIESPLEKRLSTHA